MRHLVHTIFLSMALSACTGYGPHWPVESTPMLSECQYIPDPAQSTATRLDCVTPAENSAVTAGQLKSYHLGIVEFDEYGNLFDPSRGRSLVQSIGSITQQRPFIALVYVHGWKHSAEETVNGDLREFRGTLQNVVAMENALSRETGADPRPVIGVYLGWRGGSTTVPLLEELTFWERKNTAQAVGDGAVAEVLTRLNILREQRNGRVGLEVGVKSQEYSRLIVVGHSFGGAVVHTAVSQLFVERLARAEAYGNGSGGLAGIGDLVVLVNPAFEAMRFSTLHKLSSPERPFPANQFPAFVVLTTESDSATGTMFPLGRFFSTLFETYSDRDALTFEGRKANTAAVGHYTPYVTHRLKVTAEGRSDPTAFCDQFKYPIELATTTAPLAQDTQPKSPAEEWRAGADIIHLRKSVAKTDTVPVLMELSRIQGDPHSPILNIVTDGEFMSGHSGIYSCYVLGFLNTLIGMTIAPPDATTAADEALSATIKR